ncbi:MAG: ADP-ribosylglycohydrolase family protein [Polyangiaceae bacterium]
MAPLERARRALLGLSVGDAFGERFFTNPHVALAMLERRALPAPPWGYTDDTVMAMSIVDTLEDAGTIDRDRLADLFAARYRLDPGRGYGGTAHGILERIGSGEPWREVSPSVFGGTGSMGNGGAMRAAPIGAYFADDPDRIVDEARRSAEVTHAHPEGQAGAIAVALAAAWVASGGAAPEELFDVVLAGTPDGPTRAGVERASRLALDADVRTAVSALGNGTRVISEDTVPLCIWSVARHLGRFEEALWTTASGFGDRDTTCAIVGGIVCLGPGALVPEEWIEAREPLDRMGRELLPARLWRRPGK